MLYCGKIRRLFIGFFVLACGYCAEAETFIQATDPNIQYVGRIDFSDVLSPKLSWAGTSISVNFTGKYLAVHLDDQLGSNYYNGFIDGNYDKPILIRCKKGFGKYVIASDLLPGNHSVLITKRTDGEEGFSNFIGIQLDDNEKLHSPPKRHERKIEFIGDSITSGMGNESSEEGVDYFPKDKNNFLSFGAFTARALNAEMHVISQGGIGIIVSWFDFTMSQLYEKTTAGGVNGADWDFSVWVPDVVVINLFQNDKWIIEGGAKLATPPTETQRVQAYIDFVKTVRSKYPKAYIVCTLGSMDAMAPGSKWSEYIKIAVASLKKKNPNEKLGTLFFEFTGFGAHPRVQHHQVNAVKLTEFIRKEMGW